MKDHIETHGTEISALPERAEIASYFLRDGGIEDLVSQIEAEVGAVLHDYTTAKGRKAARSYARKVTSSKTLLETVRKEITADWRDKTAKVNAVGKIAVERLDALVDVIRGPADEFDRKEAERQAVHLRAMDQFDIEALNVHSRAADLSSRIQLIEAVAIGPEWEEFEAEAREKKAAALAKFQSDLAIAEDREAAERELEELRREKAEREAKEADERAKAEAEAVAKAAEEQRQQEKAAAEERARQEAEQAAKDREESLAREKAEAEERHRQELEAAKARELEAAAAERKRIEDEQRAAEEAEAQRRADAEHRAHVRTEIVQAFTNLGPEDWEAAVDAMIDGKIPHIRVHL